MFSSVVSDAAWALARAAQPFKGALPRLIGRLAAEEDRATVRDLLRVLGQVGPAAHGALPWVQARLHDPRLFPAALLAWRTIRPHDPRLLDLLREQLVADAPLRALVAASVGKLRLDGPEWTTMLDALAIQADAHTRHVARQALRKIRI